MNGMNANVGVGLLVQDIGKMVSFYRNIMEFETDWDGGLFAEFRTNSGPLSLFMYDRKAFAEAVSEPVTYPFGIRNFYVADPEGNLLEIGSRGHEE